MSHLAATLGPTAYWYLTRATGFVALVLLTAILVLGVTGALRVSAPRWPRFAIDTLHRDLSLLAIAFIAIHVVTTVLDGFAPIGLIDAIIPFHSAYRPLWLGLGAAAFDLMIALVITSLVRRRLGYRAWRAIHWLAYASWPVAVLHGLGTGSDTKQAWGLLLTFACVVAVSIAAIVRVARDDTVLGSLRGPAVGAAVVVPAALLGFTVLGPLAPHWAARAGTPSRLLFTSAKVVPARAPAVTRRATAAAPTHLKLPFSANLDGTIHQTNTGAGAILDIELHVSGQVSGALRIRLAGQPNPGGGLSMVGSQVDLIAAGLPRALEGKVTSLAGTHLSAHVTGTPQPPVDLTANLQIDNQAGTVTGTLEGRAAR